MADETTQFILGDAAADALGERRKRRFFGRRKSARERLTHCENCGAELVGEYCAKCGQHAIDYRRSVVRVLIDAADSFLNWDTKFLKSVGVLLVRPWRLTNDFNAGRRVRYVHPLRLYLLASIAFFLLARLFDFNGTNALQFEPKDREQMEVALAKLAAPDSGLDEAERAKVADARAKLAETDEKLSPKDRERLRFALGTLIGTSMKQKFREKDHQRLNKALDRVNAINASPTPAAPPEGSTVDSSPLPLAQATPGEHPEATPTASATREDQIGVNFSYGNKDPFGQWMETRIKDKIGEDGTKSKLFLETLRSNVPTMMLACVPLFAFVLKVLYIRQRRFYVEHLVYALHIHTFVYIAVVVITLIGMALLRVAPGVQPVIVTALSFVVTGLVFVSIRRVYRQGWFMTIFKFVLGGTAYVTVLVTALIVTAFITLLLP